MLRIQINKQGDDIRKAMESLKPAEVQKACMRAINHTLAIGKTDASKYIREIYKISAADSKHGMFVKPASQGLLVGNILASVRPFPLAMFNPVEIKGNVVTKRIATWSDKDGTKRTVYGSKKTTLKTIGVSVTIKNGQKKTIRSAYLNFTSKGTPQVKAFGLYTSAGFQFNDTPTGVSSRINTKSVFWAVLNDNIKAKITPKMQTNYANRLQHELTKGIKH
jgi:hypothetical protein